MAKVFISEDCYTQRSILQSILEFDGYESIAFEDPSKGLAYLMETDEEPLLYLVDMRPAAIEKEVPWLDMVEGDVPEEIFNYVKKRGWDTSRFYFVSGHISTHDDGVLERTRANFIRKPMKQAHLLGLVDYHAKKLEGIIEDNEPIV